MGDYLYSIDADVELLPDTVPRLLACICEEPEAAVLGSYDDCLLSQCRNLLHYDTHQTGNDLAISGWCTPASAVGPSVASGKRFSATWPAMRTMNTP